MAKKAPKGDAEVPAKKAPKEDAFGWALNIHKLALAKKFVNDANAAHPLKGDEYEAAVKERYLEIKGPLPEAKRFKNGKLNKGEPRPTSKAAEHYDGTDEEDDEDEEDTEDAE